VIRHRTLAPGAGMRRDVRSFVVYVTLASDWSVDRSLERSSALAKRPPHSRIGQLCSLSLRYWWHWHPARLADADFRRGQPRRRSDKTRVRLAELKERDLEHFPERFELRRCGFRLFADPHHAANLSRMPASSGTLRV
jgi:hypothetical protein